MVAVNPLNREIQLKIVYYGPGLGGKTTTLQFIHETTDPDHRGKMVSLATPVDRTLYFDYLPVRLPDIGGYSLKLQLFTVPGQLHFNATRKLVLSNADGVVFVADSQQSRAEANLESLDNLLENLRDYNIDLDTFPLIFQYNKRDLDNIIPLHALDATLNPKGLPSLGTCAIHGDNVYEGLETITKEVLRDLKRRNIFAQKSTGADSGVQNLDFKKQEDGLADRLQEYSERSSIPNQEEDDDVTDAPRDVVEKALAPATGDAPQVVDRPTIPAPFALTEKVASEKKRASIPIEALQEKEAPAGFTFSSLWPRDGQHRARAVEARLGDARFGDALRLITAEADRILALSRGTSFKMSDTTVLAVMGLDSAGYADMVRWSNDADSRDITEEQALRAYLFLLQMLECGE